MPKKPNLDNYVEVNERIVEFYKRYPNGSLQSEYVPVSSPDLVVVKAYAYRTPDDPRPGMGLASEPFPGKTPYTKDSELMNAETSAWGRALAALGFEVKRAIASREEVRNRTAEEDEDANVQSPSNGKGKAAAARTLAQSAQETYAQLVEAKGKKEADQMVKMKLAELDVASLDEMTAEQAKDFHSFLKGLIPTP
jgi:hypothetical protein